VPARSHRPRLPRHGVARTIAALAALGVLSGALAGCAPPAATTDESAITIGGPFSLVDHTGARITDQDLRGRPFVVYFGFTYCPDVCPLALNKLALALEELGPDAEQFQTLLITIDPERDTPEQLALYVGNYGFPSNLIGLTGTPEEIQAVADAYRVHYKKIESPQTTASYLMEHSSVLYLMGADGRFVNVFTHASTPEEIAEGLRRHLQDS
jgi:protein SCO1/2